jgi:cyclopropane fatty-acyl-phospholipid synthase-like methyltransferase
MLDSIEGALKGFYARNLEAHGAGAQGVGWKNEQAQIVRFDQLQKLLPAAGRFSVNDLGCGTGAFADYLARHYQNFKYVGYDMLEEMIALSKSSLKGGNTEFLKIEKASDMQVADFSVASGIFNVRYGMDDQRWHQYILDTIHVLHNKSSKGFAFNALTTYSDKEFMKPELFYSDPLALFDYCKKNFSKNVALLHDYYQYDFTIIVRTI